MSQALDAARGPDTAAATTIDRRYITYLIIVAMAGWSLASYDVNLLVLALPEIAKSLSINETGLGILGFFVYGAQFVITLIAGYAMDRFGRKVVWMVCMMGAACFTGLTCFVHNFWELVAVRALASGLAYSELAVSITIVNEQLPAKNRGLLYSIVQGGWPFGVFLASGVYLAFGWLGWRLVFLFGILPIAAVMVGRVFIRESSRFEEEKAHRQASGEGVDLRSLFLTAGETRRQLVLLSIAWISYGASYVATNFYITYWLTAHKGYSSHAASTLLLICGAGGFAFYILGGLLGERLGRREVLIGAAFLTAPLALLFLYVDNKILVGLIYFLLFQISNGVWSAPGYAYQSECFPTRIRGTAVGFLAAMLVFGFVVGSILWTVVSHFDNPTLTWLAVAVAAAIPTWVTVFLRRIEPGQDLEASIA